uniref:Peptidase_M1_N domain-containing protein n=1 Tax=Angiostrongylus cantonensis TaxID=6313 RepID=A0A0K0CZN0_ANGCA
MTIRSVSGFLFIALGALASLVTSEESLSPHLVPLAYDLTIKIPVLERYDGFTASVVLHFNLTTVTPNITLHARNLHSMKSVSVISSNDSFEPILQSVRLLKETVEFTFVNPLLPGQYLLTIGEYNGRVSNASSGVFHRNRTLFTSHLQPNFARELLPCVDNPSAKAVFRMTVIHPTGTFAHSNTIANNVQIVDFRWQKTVFAPTLALPAYLLTFSLLTKFYEEVRITLDFFIH